VDLNADGEHGGSVNGVVGNPGATYEFPGTRSKRVKEIRYMYKWKEVGLEDIADAAAEPEEEAARFAEFVGREGQGWVDNGAGWILAAYIENRQGALRPQTTEELTQCIGCHANVGNTVDAVWSFQRKLPGDAGWREMDYGQYRQNRRDRTRLHDYLNVETGRGELEYFYYTVVGADLYGVMSAEIAAELQDFARRELTLKRLTLTHPVAEIFDDEQLKMLGRDARDARLRERQRIMRRYAEQREYLYHDGAEDQFYLKGAVLYPTEATMRKNVQLYRKIVLDQSFNLGKDVFGSESDHVPFTFRSDGSVADEKGNIIPVGAVITSRPYGPDGIGTTPTGIVAVNADGVPVDARRQPVDLDHSPEQVVGHIANGGTFNPMYNPILSDTALKK
jgi:cytochrome c553